MADEPEIIGETTLNDVFSGIRGQWVDVKGDRNFIDLSEGEGATDAYVYDLQAKRQIARTATINKDWRLLASVPLSIGLELDRTHPGWMEDERFLRSEIISKFGVTPRGFRRSFSGVGLAPNSKPSISTS